MNEVKRFVRRNAAAVVLVAGCVIFGVAAKGFLSLRSFSSLLSQLSIQALLATGMLFAMLVGGMDLSVAATGALAGILAAYSQNWLDMRMGNVPAVLSVLSAVMVAVVTGIAVGSGIGTLIVRTNIPALVCTLVLMYGIRGLAYAVAGGQPVVVASKSFSALGAANLVRFGKMTAGLIPVSLILAVILIIAARQFLTGTESGRKICMVGRSRQAAEKAGVNTGKVILAGYMICSVMASLAGVINTSRFQNGLPGFMDGYELYALCAVMLGGVSLRGGKGSVGKVCLGAAAVAVLKNGMDLVLFPSYWQKIIMCALTLGAVVINLRAEEENVYE
ncbi:MAG: ABC transporter permease [Lachnospiraceae bacterium]|nr:ABC transporter permease [Lachnospiraceae bacterium]